MSIIGFYSEKDPMGELSNFWKLQNPIHFQGRIYKTSEHLYQALKFILNKQSIDNDNYITEICNTNTPNMSKILGCQRVCFKYEWQKRLSNIIIEYKNKGVKIYPNWDNVKMEAMMHVLRLKFSTDTHCRTVLLSTGNSYLFEQSTDPFWGCGSYGEGKNVLGNLLMILRIEIELGTQNIGLSTWVEEHKLN